MLASLRSGCTQGLAGNSTLGRARGNVTRLTRKAGNESPHTPRLTADGRWVCSGGYRTHGVKGCDFAVSKAEYAKAVDHATLYGGTPPDMPKGMWA